jgi:hypothetical protein
MKRNSPKKKKPLNIEAALTEQQRLALIPTGPVTPARSAHGDIEVEIAASTERGEAIVMRQRSVSAVHKLLDQGLITLHEASAAHHFQIDHDGAYTSSANVLAAIRIDNAGSGEGAALRRVEQGARFRGALAYLRDELGRVALNGICGSVDQRVAGVYQSIGEDILPTCSASEQRAAGKGALILAIRGLARYYGDKYSRYHSRH